MASGWSRRERLTATSASRRRPPPGPPRAAPRPSPRAGRGPSAAATASAHRAGRPPASRTAAPGLGVVGEVDLDEHRAAGRPACRPPRSSAVDQPEPVDGVHDVGVARRPSAALLVCSWPTKCHTSGRSRQAAALAPASWSRFSRDVGDAERGEPPDVVGGQGLGDRDQGHRRRVAGRRPRRPRRCRPRTVARLAASSSVARRRSPRRTVTTPARPPGDAVAAVGEEVRRLPRCSGRDRRSRRPGRRAGRAARRAGREPACPTASSSPRRGRRPRPRAACPRAPRSRHRTRPGRAARSTRPGSAPSDVHRLQGPRDDVAAHAHAGRRARPRRHRPRRRPAGPARSRRRGPRAPPRGVAVTSASQAGTGSSGAGTASTTTTRSPCTWSIQATASTPEVLGERGAVGARPPLGRRRRGPPRLSASYGARRSPRPTGR